MSRLQQQDVLFGTSSQLALEESPTMVRQIQFAMKESERDADNLDLVACGAPSRWPRLGSAEGKRGLWAASARDGEGGMLEHLKDIYIPEPDRTQDIPLLMDSTNDMPGGQFDDQSTFIDIDDILSDPPLTISVSSNSPTPLDAAFHPCHLRNIVKIMPRGKIQASKTSTISRKSRHLRTKTLRHRTALSISMTSIFHPLRRCGNHPS